MLPNWLIGFACIPRHLTAGGLGLLTGDGDVHRPVLQRRICMFEQAGDDTSALAGNCAKFSGAGIAARAPAHWRGLAK